MIDEIDIAIEHSERDLDAAIAAQLARSRDADKALVA